MDVWDHYCHPTPFQEEMILVPAHTSEEMADFCNIRVKKTGLGSVGYMRALVRCQCVLFPGCEEGKYTPTVQAIVYFYLFLFG